MGKHKNEKKNKKAGGPGKSTSTSTNAATAAHGGSGLLSTSDGGASGKASFLQGTTNSAQAQLLATMQGLISKLQEQSDSTKEMADQYLSQGLLTEYQTAIAMKERIDENLAAVRAKLGIGGGAGAGRMTSSDPKAKNSQTSREEPPAKNVGEQAQGAGTASTKKATSPADDITAGKNKEDEQTKARLEQHVGVESNSKLEQKPSSPTAETKSIWSHPVRDSETSCGATEFDVGQAEQADATKQLQKPSYRFLSSSSATSLEHHTVAAEELEILEEPRSEDAPDVDISADWVKLRWPSSMLQLPLRPPCDPQKARVTRKKKTGKLKIELQHPPAESGATEVRASATLARELAPHLDNPKRGFGALDAFLTVPVADLLRRQILQMWRDGLLLPGEIEGPAKTGSTNANPSPSEAKPAVAPRSDVYTHIDEQKLNESTLRVFTQALDKLMLELTGSCAALEGKKLMRGRPMVTVYHGKGSRYTPHFDCVGGDNGRVATCILYLNPFWQVEHGGCLRLWPEARRKLQPEGPCFEIEPLHSRLLVFLCDSRNLHEVMPMQGGAGEPRVAVSCWYYDTEKIQEVECEN
ncbi:unnamed protein product [Amoebophrya sp. A25]|nr:unnamed protein product [Amoebophrya sp. A25]|eukprot:GSA25T00007251001.1